MTTQNNTPQANESGFVCLQENSFYGAEHRPILAVSYEIETLNLFETYSEHGQLVGHHDAGDYCLENSGCSAEKDCLNAAVAAGLIDTAEGHEIVKIGDVYHIECDGDVICGDNIASFIQSWCEENENITEVQGFNYHDGRNWKTVTVKCDSGEPTHEVLYDVEDFEKALEEMERINSIYGKTYYESEEFIIVESAHADAFEAYALYPKSEGYSTEDLSFTF